MTKVSIIIPVYNVGQYLPKCLDSIINQTLKDIEIICINDGSTDNSLSILKEYASKDDRMIIIDKENEGVSIARNEGLDIATGEYIVFVDSDDWLEINALELCYDKIIQDNSDMLVFNHREIKHNKRYEYKSFSLITQDKPFYFNNCSDDFFYVSPAMWGKFIARKILIHRFNKNVRKGEDALYLWETCIKNPKISILNEPLYNYMQRDGSAMHNTNLIDNCELFKAVNILINKEDFYKAPENIQIQILERFCKSIWWELHILPKTHELSNLYKKEYKNFNKLFRQYDAKTLKRLHFIKKMKKEYNKKDVIFYKKIISKLFSIKKIESKKHKKIKITFIGVKINFKYLKEVWKNEKKLLNKIKKNQANFSKDTYLLFDCLHDENTECIDAYSLFCYMKSKNIKSYYVLLEQNKLYKRLKENNELEDVLVIKNSTRTHPDEFLETIYDTLLKTKCIITSFGENSCSVNKFFQKNKYLKYVFIQHGQMYLKESVMKNKYLYPSKFDKFLVSSNEEENIFIQYGWSKDKLIKVGLPRWDLLNINNAPMEKSILFMFTWRNITQHKFDISLYKKKLSQLLNNDDLCKYLASKNIKLYFAPHHALKTNSNVTFYINNSNIQIINPQDISKYIKQCSMLVTDFSSVVFDFMFQDKPVICYGLDLDDKVLIPLEQEDLQGLKDKQQEFPNILFDEESVINKIKYYVENDFVVEDENLKKYQNFFYTKENIREKLTQELERICKS